MKETLTDLLTALPLHLPGEEHCGHHGVHSQVEEILHLCYENFWWNNTKFLNISHHWIYSNSISTALDCNIYVWTNHLFADQHLQCCVLRSVAAVYCICREQSRHRQGLGNSQISVLVYHNNDYSLLTIVFAAKNNPKRKVWNIQLLCRYAYTDKK